MSLHLSVSHSVHRGEGSLSGRSPPGTETPSLDRDPLPGQRPPPWTETPQTETPLDRDPTGQTPHPWTETPRQRPLDREPRTETPLGREPPYGNERAVRILLECILVYFMPLYFRYLKKSWEV